MENKEQRTKNKKRRTRKKNKEQRKRGAKDELFQGSDLLVKVRLPLLLSRGAL